jgi:hypothetical protein
VTPDEYELIRVSVHNLTQTAIVLIDIGHELGQPREAVMPHVTHCLRATKALALAAGMTLLQFRQIQQRAMNGTVAELGRQCCAAGQTPSAVAVFDQRQAELRDSLQAAVDAATKEST